MNEKLKTLAQLRDRFAVAQAERKQLEKELLDFPAYTDLVATEKDLKEALQVAEDELRAFALDQFNQDGEKVKDGWKIKSFTIVSIPDVKRATDWCLRNFTPALKLDEKVFKDTAKSGNVPDEVDSDLSRFLGK